MRSSPSSLHPSRREGKVRRTETNPIVISGGSGEFSADLCGGWSASLVSCENFLPPDQLARSNLVDEAGAQVSISERLDLFGSDMTTVFREIVIR